MVRTKTESHAFWLLIGVVFGMLVMVLAYEAGWREPLWQRYDAWRLQRQNRAGLTQTPVPGAIPLTRTDLFYPEAAMAGVAHDRALFADLDTGSLTATRQAGLAAQWPSATGDPAAFRDAIEPQRDLLREYLGPLPDGPATITERHTIPLPISFCRDGPAEAEQLAIASRWPDVTFTAYLVRPTTRDNGHAVVALHGHSSSPERLLGLEAEDYGRQLALRLACAGYTVIVPAVTSDGAANSAISARLALEDATLYGLMVSQILSAVDVLQTELPDRPVGLYGISNGGLLALFSNAVDDRPTFVVAESILTPYWENILIPTLSRTGRTEYFFYFNGPLWLDFDMAGLALLSWPDTLLFTVGSLDSERSGWERQWEPIRTTYAALDLAEQTELILFHGYHELAENLAIDRLGEMLP